MAYLTKPVPGDPDGWSGYRRTAEEIGTATKTDFMFPTTFHNTLHTALNTAAPIISRIKNLRCYSENMTTALRARTTPAVRTRRS